MADEIPTQQFWPLSKELGRLHNIVIHYAVEVQKATNTLPPENRPISFDAFAILHTRAVILHRSIRELCERGWTPAAGVLIRTLLDLYINILAIVIKPEDSEFMAYRYLLAFQLGRVNDSSLDKQARKQHGKELQEALVHLSPEDQTRMKAVLEDKASRSYWFQPEHRSPSELLKKTKGEMPSLYRTFSGSTHGGVVGSALLDDEPDNFDINPKQHPRRTPLAIAASSRLLLEITFLRDSAQGTGQTAGYHFIKDKIFLPMKALVEGIDTNGSE